MFWHLTDNWIELAVRFVVPEHGVREIKDRVSRAILAAFRRGGLEVASSTSEVTIYERRHA